MRRFEQIVAAQRKLEDLGGILVFRPEPATTEDSLNKAEQQLGLPFAPSHRRFLKQNNGCEIKILPHFGAYASGIEIFDTHTSVEKTLSYRLMYNTKPYHVARPPFWRQLVIIGRGGSGDYVLTDAETPSTDGECPILDGFSEDPPSWRSRVIARSFGDWVDRIFSSITNGKAPQYWVAEDETIAEAFEKWPRIEADDSG